MRETVWPYDSEDMHCPLLESHWVQPTQDWQEALPPAEKVPEEQAWHEPLTSWAPELQVKHSPVVEEQVWQLVQIWQS